MKKLGKAISAAFSTIGVGIVRMMACLPFCVLYVFADVIFVLLYYVLRYRRRMVRANMRAAFADADDEILRSYIRGFYRNFADYIVETVKLLHIKDESMARRIKFDGLEIIEEHLKQGRSVVAYFSHTFNWEWAPSITMHVSPEIKSKTTFGQIYRPLRNSEWDKLMLRVRSRFGSESIPKKVTLRHLLQSHKTGKLTLTGFMSDQKPSHGDAEHIIEFLGQRTRVIVGTETLARRMQMAAVYWDMFKESRGHYRITVRPICDNVADTGQGEVTDKYFKLLEQTIRRQPQIWLWSHNRWQRNRRNPEKSITNA